MLPSKLKLADAKPSVCPDKVINSLPLDTPHIFAVLSIDAVTIFELSVLNLAVTKTSVCPDKSNNILPLDESHIFAVSSNDAVTTFEPSELNSEYSTKST